MLFPPYFTITLFVTTSYILDFAPHFVGGALKAMLITKM